LSGSNELLIRYRDNPLASVRSGSSMVYIALNAFAA
jgi:hypothetical protein